MHIERFRFIASISLPLSCHFWLRILYSVFSPSKLCRSNVSCTHIFVRLCDCRSMIAFKYCPRNELLHCFIGHCWLLLVKCLFLNVVFNSIDMDEIHGNGIWRHKFFEKLLMLLWMIHLFTYSIRWLILNVQIANYSHSRSNECIQLFQFHFTETDKQKQTLCWTFCQILMLFCYQLNPVYLCTCSCSC